jgi:hypothetical protein
MFPLPIMLLLIGFCFAEPGDSIAKSQIQYIPLPPQSEPLNSLLPQKGISDGRPLKPSKPFMVYEHGIDFESRTSVVNAGVANSISKDTSELWSAFYPELADYSMDMYDIGFNRLWLNSLIGQRSGESDPEGSLFNISLPMKIPSWMKDFGFDRPQLLLQGTMDIRLNGMGVYDDAPGSTEKSLFPTPNLSYVPSFVVQGKIGRNITVEMNHTEGGLGVRNKVRVVYAEATPGEFEDYILQRLEAGNTSISLAGTELTGYAEQHQGLFGLKAELKFGKWRLTTIASQDAGSQESYTIRGNDESAEFQIQDRQFSAYRYYFLTHDMRNNYITARINGRMPSRQNVPGLKVYRRNLQDTRNAVVDNAVGVYFPNGSDVPVRKLGIPLIEMQSGTDYVFDDRTGILRVKSGNQNMLIAVSWSGDRTSRSSTAAVRNGEEVLLVQYDAAASDLAGIDKLMLRNVYPVGISSDNASNFILRMKDRSRNPVADGLKTLGVADTVTGTILTGDVSIFPKEGGEYTGDMHLPCRDITWYRSKNFANPEAVARERCLEPLRNIDSTAIAGLYTKTVQSVLSSSHQSLYYFEAVGKRRRSSISVRDPNSSYSVSGGGCLDIAPNSEKLKAGSEVLVRDVDYQVNYELGQIELLSERALDPNKEITVNFECEPLFELQSKLLLGARAEYPIENFGEGSLLGITALYKNQSVSTENPRLGGEPFSSLLLGTNIRLRDTSQTMDKIINAVPFIDSKEKSRWSFEGEFAASYHNANTSSRKSALIDDFESSALNLQFPLNRLSWFKASPPGGLLSDGREYLSYMSNGEFVWHSNTTVLHRHIYTRVGSSDIDNRELTILSLRLKPNDNLSGRSWGGIMRPNSYYYQDLSQKRYIEIVARGNVGSLYVDLGAISEDISINGFAPNGFLDSECDIGKRTALHDNGLGYGTQAYERLRAWDCRYAQCSPTDYSSANVSGVNNDVSKNKFNANLLDLSDPPVQINGTRSNAGERTCDSEDINNNGQLDLDNNFVRYRVQLDTEDETKFEKLQNGWRRFRIPLDQFDSVVSSSGNTAVELLTQAHVTRLWYGSLGSGIAEGRVQIADFKIVGNEWLESEPKNEFGIVSDPNTQEVTGGINTNISAPGTVIVPDSNYMKISVIDNREYVGFYYTSPNTPLERDPDTNTPFKEQSLLLEYGGLHPRQEVSATRFFDNEVKDFTSYKNIQMEIHYETRAEKTPIRFALQFGRGGIDGSADYYEWSFKPIKIECGASERIQDCHERNWKMNAFSLPLAKFSNLKVGRSPPFLTSTEEDLGGEREEKIKLVGNPSGSRVDWIRFVVIADDDATLEDLNGTFWINDLRLSGMSNAWGYATRMHGQLDFADVLSVSGELRYQDGDFATLKSDGRSPKPNLSEANTSLDVNGSASLNINKFFKDDYGLRLPFGVGYSSTTLRPYLKPDDDVQLSHDDAFDMFSDFSTASLEAGSLQEEDSLRMNSESKGYQSFSRSRTLSLGFTKEYKKSDNIVQEIFGQIFLERPALNYSYRETERRSAKVADSSYQYNTVLEYKLGTFERTNSFLFGNKSMPIELWPGTFDLTLMDLAYSRNVYQERDPNFMDPQVDKIINYTTDLRHKADIRWNILPFLSLNYTLNVNRDMYGGGDRQAFAKEDFFSLDGDGGLFAKNFIFDHDHYDRKIYYKEVPYVYAQDDSLYSSTDTTYFYEIDSVGSRDYGKAYGILRNERNRRQDFRANFSPNIISFLPMRFSFNSGFNQSKSIPNEFDFFNEDHLDKNFWTIQQNTRFEFAPSLRLPQLAGIAGKNAVSNFFEKLKWREIRSTWSVDLQTNGEDFTLWQLHDEQGVDPLQYYLFGLGIGNGYRNRGFWNLVSGDMGLDSRRDYEGFAQYRNKKTDSLVYQNRFEHSVRRSLSTNTSLTLPFWDIGVRGDLTWSEEFRQTRETPLYVDTVTVWPRLGIGIDIPNFVNRLDFLKGRLRSLSTSHRFDYQEKQTVRPYQSSEDEWLTTIDFNPIIRISALTQGNIRIDNSVRFKTEERIGRVKLELLENPDEYDEEEYIKVPWLYTDKVVDRGYAAGDELAISYALKTKRGFQLWRWYVKLDNDIDLRLESGYNYRKIIQENYSPDSAYAKTGPKMPEGSTGVHYIFEDPNGKDNWTSYVPELARTLRNVTTRAHEWYIRPKAAYSFSKMASASAYIEYRWLREQMSSGGVHTRQSLAFEIAAMLRFN